MFKKPVYGEDCRRAVKINLLFGDVFEVFCAILSIFDIKFSYIMSAISEFQKYGKINTFVKKVVFRESL